MPFTEKSEVKSPMKKKKAKNQKKEAIPPSETYLQSATKENPISIGRDISPPQDMNLSNQSFNMKLNQSISGTVLNISKFDYEISAHE